MDSTTRVIPLSLQQQALWRAFGPQQIPVSHCVLRMGKRWSRAQVLTACERLVARHDLLRSVVRVDGNTPVMAIQESADLQFQEIEAGPSGSGVEEPLAEIVRAQRGVEFPVGEQARLRVTLLSHDDAAWLVIAASALCVDGSSWRLLARDFAHLSQGAGSGPVAQSYLDYCLWQNDVIESDDEELGAPYWTLTDWAAIPALVLPQARERSGGERGHWLSSAALSSTAFRDMQRLCEREALDIEGLVFAAFSAFLAKLTTCREMRIGYVVDGRSLDELQSCVGVLAKTMPLCVQVTESATLAEQTRSARALMNTAHDWQDTFNVTDPAVTSPEEGHRIAFECYREEAMALDTLCLEEHIGVHDPSHLKLVVRIRGDGIRLDVVARRDSFFEPDVRAFADGVSQWLETALADGAVPLMRRSLLRPESIQHALAELNANPATVPRPLCAHELFAEWAESTPDAIAAVEADKCLSYEGIQRWAARVAGFLERAGVRPWDVVAIYLPRSVELLVSVLAVHKLGACCLLTDVQQPTKRTERTLRDAGARAVLSLRKLDPVVRGLHARPLYLDDVRLEEPPSGGVSRVPLESPAYILYTSGSTGQPKGVTVTHESLTSYLQCARESYATHPNPRALLHTSPGVDLSITALLMPLIAGGGVEIVSEDEGIDGLFRLLRENEHLGVMKMTPTHASLLQSHLRPEDYALAKFDAIVIGGEALGYEQIQPWLAAGGPPVVNEYGPTEATVACCAFVAQPGPTQGRVPIGRPIANARLYVVDSAMNPVPAGVRGELLIGGPGLAQAYANNPAITADRFRPDPFAASPGARLYRSGDRVVARGSQLEYLGRLDRQVKLRGHRIELGEIESVLQRHPDVAVAAVDITSDAEPQIVAYVVPRADIQPDTLTPRLLREYCKEQLTVQMLPGSFILLEHLPLTASGKIDRRALAQHTRAPEPESGHVPPRDDLERTLVSVWQAHLGDRPIGIRDNFFDLGGHSMLAIRILFDIRARLQTQLDLVDIFDRPTIEELAGRVRQHSARGDSQAPVQALEQIEPDPANRYEPFTLTDVQQAYWVGQTDAYALGNVGAHVYQETQFNGLDVERLQQSFRKLIERHDMLRAVILPDGRQQVLEKVPEYDIPLFDLRSRSKEEQRVFIAGVRERMSHQVFDLAKWPLFEVSACLIDDRHVRLHLSFDALIADAWSFEILLRDFSMLYMRPDVTLPALRLHFRDYVMATAGRPDAPLFLQAQAYWKDRIAALPPAPQLPMVKQLREIEAPKFGRRRHIVPAEQWSRIKRKAAASGATPSALMLTAFAEALALWSRSQSFTLVLTVFNRPPLHPDIDEIMGDFTSLVLVDFRPSTLPFGKRVLAVQKLLMERLEHRYFSGVRVLRELARGRTDKSTPLMPVVFTSTLTHERTEEAAFLKEQQVEAMGINQTPQVYLDHQLVEENGELQFNWDSVDELFPDGLLDGMFEQYRAFVDSLADERTWDNVPDLLPHTAYDAYRKLNDTSVPLTSGLAFDPILAHAARHPEAVAVITPARELSYGELLSISWKVAHALRKRGAKPGHIVGILLEKGWEQVAAVLGIQLAGAAYLPIDVQAPPERIEYLMADSGVQILVTNSALRQGLAREAQYLLWDAPAWFETEPDTAMQLAQSPGDLAYLMYTSGSTGRPKGVMIEHRSIVNRMADVRQRFAITSADRAIGLTALHHDLSVFDIFGVLGAGGALVLPFAGRQHDPLHWMELLEAARVTLWNSVPSFLAMLTEFHANHSGVLLDGGGLLRILLSGDKVPIALIRRARQLLPLAKYTSLGGPTETTVWDIWHPIRPLESYDQRLPYGAPLNNSRYYVINEADRLCPIDVPGELCIAGEGLARGYWNDSERTDAKFVRHAATGERLYRSGDLGCLRPTGELDILGRIDLQVKIQGQRIELEEIELALQQYPSVRAAAVIVKTDPVRGPYLLSYLEVDRPTEGASEAPPGSVDQEGMLLNAIERIQFKMDQRGIRTDLDAREHLQLVRPELSEDFLRGVMRRRTQRRFEPGPIGLAQFSGLLSVLMQVMPEGFAMPKYQYPSAGNAYPLQFYVLVRAGRVQGVSEGVYYYHPRDHRLIQLSPDGNWEDTLHPANNVPVSQEAAFSLFVICEMDAMRPLYGKMARDFGLLEAGYVSQLLMSRAPELNLGLCPLGTMDFEPLRARLALRESHVLFHGFLGGAIPQAELSDPRLYLTDASKKWSQQAEAPGAGEFAEFLRKRLPRHMIPDRFAVLDRLPLTTNGKVDRAALQSMEEQVVSVGGYVEPQTPLQKALAGLWSEVLGVERTGLRDDFFQLGGDSILAIQLMNRLKSSFSTDIALRDVLAATTVEQLAEVLERRLAADLEREALAEGPPGAGTRE